MLLLPMILLVSLFSREGGCQTTRSVEVRPQVYHLLVCYTKSWKMRIIYFEPQYARS